MKNTAIQKVLILPVSVAIGIIASLAIEYIFDQPNIAIGVMIVTVLFGASRFLYDTLRSLLRGKFGLDYIALAAIITAFITKEYLVSGVIVLMLTTGEALEEYAMVRAKKSLLSLIDRIPKNVTLIDANEASRESTVEAVKVGDRILVRRGEVIPLDGILETAVGLADESSLTGEPYYIDKVRHDVVRSGTVNVGDVMIMRVTTADDQSTYRKIIRLVQDAQQSQAPLVRLADKYSRIFTILTALISGAAFFFTRDIHIVLSVLVVATPCPLLLATPIALIGGMNAAARQKIIIKNLASIEVLSRAQALVFDKTGTITLGHPTLQEIEILDKSYEEKRILGIASAIEHNSLHPLAKAIVHHAKEKYIQTLTAQHVEETIGLGISGFVDGARYTLAKHHDTHGLSIELRTGEQMIALFHFEDQIKIDSQKQLRFLEKSGFEMFMLTGDKQTVADSLAHSIGVDITVKGNCSPEDKLAYIEKLRQEQKITVMVGDGINDAPALATAHVGIVFANEEHTAASEAADIVLLGGDFSLVLRVLSIAKRTISIAMQSIWVGIGLSVLSMIAAACGLLPPLIGAIWQECIDVMVIINALRASRG